MARTITIPKYNSATGEGTLSNLSRAYGVSVDDIMKANVGNASVKDRNTIYAGGSLILPDAGPQQTTTSLREEVNKRNAEFDKREAEAAALEKEQKQARLQGYDPTADNEAVKDEGRATVNKVSSDYDRVQRRVDAAHRQLLSAIKTTYTARIDKMKDSNDRLLKLKEAVGIRQGRSRYAPVVQAGILTEEEMAGHERIMEIEGTMLQEVARLNDAKAKGDYARLNDMYDRIDEATNRMNEQIEANFKLAIDTDKQIQAQMDAERKALQEEFDRNMEISKRVAPAIAKALEGYGSDEEKQAFLQAYSEKSGIPVDLLMGDVEAGAMDRKKDELDVKQKQASIANTYDQIAKRKDQNKAGDEDVSDYTSNIMDGLSRYSDIDEDDVDTREKVKSELAQYGFFDNNPPQWYVAEYEKQAKSKGDSALTTGEIQMAWAEYRRKRGILD